MDENEKIEEIKEKILDRINIALDCITINDVQKSIIIKNLVESYDVLNNIYYGGDL